MILPLGFGAGFQLPLVISFSSAWEFSRSKTTQAMEDFRYGDRHRGGDSHSADPYSMSFSPVRWCCCFSAASCVQTDAEEEERVRVVG